MGYIHTSEFQNNEKKILEAKPVVITFFLLTQLLATLNVFKFLRATP